MIEAINIEKSYGSLKILKGVSLKIDKAEIVSIVGLSGAGKSTLLQILGSLLPADQGKVIVDGVDISSLSNDELCSLRNQKIGFVFQFHHLLPEFTALENVMLPALIAKRPHSEVKAEANRLLVEFGLEDRITHKPSELSGGEQQRVAIARALINKPSVLFADEPSGNLDSMTKEDIHKIFFTLRDKYQISIIIVTHDKDLASMSDRMLEMRDGQFI